MQSHRIIGSTGPPTPSLPTGQNDDVKYKADFVLDLRIENYEMQAKVWCSMKDRNLTPFLEVD